MGMKIIGTFTLAVAAGFALMQSADARGGHYSGGAHFSGGGHFSAPARSYGGARSYAGPRSYGGPSRNFSSAVGRYYSGPRYSPSTGALRNPTYVSGERRFSGDRTAAYNSRSDAQFTPGTRTTANRSHGFDRTRVVAQHSANTWHRHWDRGHDHWWHGHRCHFRNGFWFIYDPFPFYPYGYGFDLYPYAPYYESSYYDDGTYAADDYAQAPDTNRSEYAVDSQVSQVQSALAREGYYDGAVDGKLGPATRSALRRYQRDHRLEATGGITSGVIQSLRLR